MTLALMAIGAMLGLVLNFGHGMGSLLTMLLGGFAGYALVELDALRVRGGQLEKKVEELKKQLAELRGRQRDSAGRPEEPVVWTPVWAPGLAEEREMVRQSGSGSEPTEIGRASCRERV